LPCRLGQFSRRFLLSCLSFSHRSLGYNFQPNLAPTDMQSACSSEFDMEDRSVGRWTSLMILDSRLPFRPWSHDLLPAGCLVTYLDTKAALSVHFNKCVYLSARYGALLAGYSVADLGANAALFPTATLVPTASLLVSHKFVYCCARAGALISLNRFSTWLTSEPLNSPSSFAS
jgi:hypothetical protein